MFWDLWGWVAASFGMASGLPQIIRLLRERSSAGVSLRLWQLNMAAFMGWTFHGVRVGHPQMQYPNGFLVLCSLLVLRMIVKDRGLKLVPRLVLPLGLFAVLAAVDVWLGAVAFGFAVAAPLVLGQVAQLREMMTAADLSGVSPFYLVIGLVVQALWVIWSIPTHERSIFVCGSLLGTLCFVNLVYWLYRRARSMSA